MAIEYFGFTINANSVDSGTGAAYDINNTYTFTSPGTTDDTYRVDSLEMYTAGVSGGESLRLALYTSGLSLVVQGSSALTLNTTAEWKVHTAANLTPSGGSQGGNAYITGGTAYRIAVSKNGAIKYYDSSLGFSDSWRYDTTNYTGGFPSTVSIPANQDYTLSSWAVRVGVELYEDASISITAGGAGALTAAGQAPVLDLGIIPGAGTITVAGEAPTKIERGLRYAYPTADTTAGPWSASTGSDLYAMIDEESASDTDYIYANATGTGKFKILPVTDPASSSGHVVNYRIWSPVGGNAKVRLVQGSTTVVEWTHTGLPTTATLYSQSLTGEQADAITDYDDLYLEFEAT